jgi:hypothetical protein
MYGNNFKRIDKPLILKLKNCFNPFLERFKTAEMFDFKVVIVVNQRFLQKNFISFFGTNSSKKIHYAEQRLYSRRGKC